METSKVSRMADKAMENLVEAVEKGKSSKMQAYLAMLGRFHRYSLGNVLLIASQRSGATRVAGYRTWKQLGRQVKKGEKGIRILAPIVIRKKEETVSEDEDEVIAFKAACVFDVSQTEGKELPEFAKVKGRPGEALERLRELVAEQGIELEYSNRIGPAEGMSAGGKIVLRQDLEQGAEFSVLVHELAHEMLYQRDGRPENKTVRETEAEAVAFAVCQAVGLDTNSAASDYIQLYDGKKETLFASLARIKDTAGEIIGAVTGERRHEQPQLAAAA